MKSLVVCLLTAGALAALGCSDSTAEAGMTSSNPPGSTGDVEEPPADGEAPAGDAGTQMGSDAEQSKSETTVAEGDTAQPQGDAANPPIEEDGCLAVVICLTGCAADLACEAGCMAAGSDHALALLQAAAPCFGDDDGVSSDECVDKILACIDPSGPDACGAVFECTMACGGSEGPLCMFECLHGGTVAAAEEAWHVIECLQADKDGNDGCTEPVLGCLAPTGTEGCIGVPTCMQGCRGDSEGPDCLFECLKQGSADGAAQAMAAQSCWGGGDDGTEDVCIDALVACFDPAGDGDCKAVGACLKGCVPEKDKGPDLACAGECMKTMSVQGLKDFLVVNKCEDKCKADCDDDAVCESLCVAANCGAAVAACQ